MRANSQKINPDKIAAYRNTFIKHVHLLVWQGYSRLDRSQLQSMHEPAITGLICEQVAHILDDPSSPPWVADYEIHDDPPVHDKVRRGKKRRRVDLKLASRRFRPRARFCFEAKCLNKTAGATAYLGPDGLGQFISGGYASNDSHAGMLAYVQTDDSSIWCLNLFERIKAKTYRLTTSGGWTKITIAKELACCFRTIHKRRRGLGEITVIHTCFDCY